VLVIDHELRVVDSASREFTQITPHPGWVEHNPEEIFETVRACLNEVTAKHSLGKHNVRAIGITNQRETTVAFSRKSGKPYHNALVWLDQRTLGVVNEIKAKHNGNSDVFRPICGLPINTYFSAVKMRWLLQNSKEVSSNTDDLIFGTIDTWLIAKLSGLTSFVTDSSNASRTMLMDINTLEWSEKMLEAF